MKLGRLASLISPRRWRACRELFLHTAPSYWKTAFLHAGPSRLTLKDGRSLEVSRAAGDYRFWDWFFANRPGELQFTDAGEIVLDLPGASLLVRPGTTDDVYLREMFFEDSYGLKSMPALESVLDLGGNVGYFSCAAFPKSKRLITVEASAALHRQATKNLVRNGGRAEDVLHRAVAGTSGQEVTLHVAPKNTGAATIRADLTEKRHLESERVTTIDLADLLARLGTPRVSLVKCDIEGAEFDVILQTPKQVLQRIDRLVMEVHLRSDEHRELRQQMRARLEDAGLRIAVRPLPSHASLALEIWNVERAV